MALDFNTLLGDTLRERYESIYVRLIEMFNLLVKNAPKTNLAWICCGPEISSIFETVTAGFGPAQMYPDFLSEDENDHPVYKGTINNRWRLFSHSMFPVGVLLMGVGRELKTISVGRITLDNFVI